MRHWSRVEQWDAKLVKVRKKRCGGEKKKKKRSLKMRKGRTGTRRRDQPKSKKEFHSVVEKKG